MYFSDSLGHIHDSTSVSSNRVQPAILKSQLAKLLKQGGNFPVSESFITEVRRISHLENISPEKVADSLYLEPLSAVRLLSLCNSVSYSGAQQAKSIDTLMQRVGVLRVSETLADLGKPAELGKALSGRALASVAYQDLILKSLLLDRLFPLFYKEKIQDYSYRQILYVRDLALFGLAYAKPNLFSACELDASFEEKSTFEKCFRRLVEKSFYEFSSELSAELGLPDELPKLIELTAVSPWNRKSARGVTDVLSCALTATFMVESVCKPITGFADSHLLTSVLKEFENKLKLPREKFFEAISGICSDYYDRITLLKLPMVRLPEYLHTYNEQVVAEDGSIEEDTRRWPIAAKMLKPFLIELKACLNTTSTGDEPARLPQAVNITLKSLVRALDFDRAVLFRYEENSDSLVPCNIFGRDVPDFTSYRCELSEVSDYLAIKKAFESKQLTYQGDPVFGDDWPFIAFPIIWKDRVRAVFYADKKQTKKALPLSTDEQVSSMALSEIWQNVPEKFY